MHAADVGGKIAIAYVDNLRVEDAYSSALCVKMVRVRGTATIQMKAAMGYGKGNLLRVN